MRVNVLILREPIKVDSPPPPLLCPLTGHKFELFLTSSVNATSYIFLSSLMRFAVISRSVVLLISSSAEQPPWRTGSVFAIRAQRTRPVAVVAGHVLETAEEGERR